ncbi:SusD/RagB family nutrient-binding outer membrane lipoprotein [Chitinophaga sp. S165]|uniref:SusD/RagB family nutrient-binding outer membrane lipoprotein n=1 Tax=Chitinophaga sp. S165 TaxID=2135462 RepID=UPI000D719026|nr:SusD/RagB family nutrient-binding outer membrane lipoprotein [Chitinophaga sp. S165]PWV44842.1 SusD-like starch-binding protein associating with outer membrane [Chitinophaga sp. S165]
MKLAKYILGLAVAAVVLSSCTKELEDINKNPNEAETPSPDYLLSNGIKANADTYWGTDATMETSLLYVQYWAKIQYPDPDRYIPASTNIQTVWNNFYAQGVTDFTKLVQLGDTLHNPNYKAVGIIMRSWIFQVLTDLYGDVPYKQAAQIEQYLTPVYDPQRDVYFGLLTELKNAVALIDPTGNPIAGDLMYNGDMSKWRKFANSLRLRIALRISDQELEAARTVFNEIGADDNNLIIDNSDNAKLIYQPSPYQNPVARNRETRNDYRISKSMVDKLNELSDPRLTIYAAPARDTNKIIGVTNGLSADSASRLGLNKTSDVGAVFTATLAPAIFFNAAEMWFIKAEAAQRGLLTGNAATLYAQAVTTAMKQYNVSDDKIVTYLAQPKVLYNSANYKQSIGEQKWLALFSEGLEGFAEWRRLDYPQLPAAYTGTLGGKIPLRLTYPSSEQALNGVNYRDAVKNQGADLLTTRLWFDKE